MTICPHCCVPDDIARAAALYDAGYKAGKSGRRKERLETLVLDPWPVVAVAVAAQESGLSRRTLYYWMRTGLLPFERVRGHRFVKLVDVFARAPYGRWKTIARKAGPKTVRVYDTKSHASSTMVEEVGA